MIVPSKKSSKHSLRIKLPPSEASHLLAGLEATRPELDGAADDLITLLRKAGITPSEPDHARAKNPAAKN